MQMPPTEPLASVTALLRTLGNPQNALRFVHIAGTNGKGSTAAFLSAILCASNYRVGLFTSPHVVEYAERIQVNGTCIPQAALAEVHARVDAAAAQEQTTPHFFAHALCAALLYFADERCDIVVLEAGLGGRLDPTNIIACPEVALIARIGLDHTDVLGKTLSSIAREKAGIIKPTGLVGVLRQNARVLRVISTQCDAVGARLFITKNAHAKRLAGSGWALVTMFGSYALGLGGSYQAQNASLALLGAELLRMRGFIIPEAALCFGLQHATWPARFERVWENPVTILDGAHNPQGVRTLLQSLTREWPNSRFVFVMGCMRGKDYERSAALVAAYAHAVVATEPPGERALCAEELANALRPHCANVYAQADIAAALKLAFGLSAQLGGQTVCVLGSLYLAGKVKQILNGMG